MISTFLSGGKEYCAMVMKLLLIVMCMIFPVHAAMLQSSASPESPELQNALKRIDEVSKSFRNFRADFSQKKYTAILEEFDVPESGVFYYAYDSNRSILMRHEITSPGNRILTIKGDTAVIYQPRIKQAQIANLGKRKNLLEYLGTGLGQSSASLRERYHLSYGGSDVVNDTSCDVIVFRPKDASVSASLESITIWFNKKNGVPVRYRLLEPNGDYLLLTFYGERLNTKIPASTFEQNLPNGVEILRIH
ncbi:MAG TPA: outer membrane lipoprotein carrier protein LolA [Acidobacteriota bacterium]|nr:outer membrane lipoprotein carrier protein LolA [Acidobacteriota bacterium]